jgi:photosystem II stability/assembly factor-like uncharacterized protein
MKKSIIGLLLLLVTGMLSAQTPRIEILTSDVKSSLRGLAVVNDNIIWVSGSNGTVGKSSNGGKNWKWMVVKGFEKIEFRDIEAWDANNAIIMSSGKEPAYILKTSDGGESWRVVFENKTPGMFLDAMDFASTRYGMVVGDPINGNVFIARTEDGGNTWKVDQQRPVTDSGEAFFAASGTNLRLFGNKHYFMVSGGTRSRLITSTGIEDIPFIQGSESAGANSIDIFDDGITKVPGQRMVIVGGDFNNFSSSEKNCIYSTNGGKSWKVPETPPHGYRSCVEFLSKKAILACGINGVDFSNDGGRTWQWISKEGFHVCKIARFGPAIFLAGENGKIGKLTGL